MEEVIKIRYILQFDNGINEWRAVQPSSFNSEYQAQQAFHKIMDDPRNFYHKAERFRIVQVVEKKTVMGYLP